MSFKQKETAFKFKKKHQVISFIVLYSVAYQRYRLFFLKNYAVNSFPLSAQAIILNFTKEGGKESDIYWYYLFF